MRRRKPPFVQRLRERDQEAAGEAPASVPFDLCRPTADGGDAVWSRYLAAFVWGSLDGTLLVAEARACKLRLACWFRAAAQRRDSSGIACNRARFRMRPQSELGFAQP